MTSYDHFLRLLAGIGLVIGGLVLTALVSALIMLMGGMSLTEMMQLNDSGGLGFSAGLTRSLLMAQHIFSFILPGIAFALLYYRKKWLSGMQLNLNPGWSLSLLGIMLLIAAYPLVNLSFLINESIPLPAWAALFEDQAADTLKAILHMPTPWLLILNLILIAILPGIGEELIFRGILQKQLALIMKSPVLAIWIAAFLFSAIHLQFEGFLPRMVLGATLGYLYYWTGNLWVPVIAHAFNNGVQILIIYATDIDITTLDEQSSHQLKAWMLPLSVGLMYITFTAIYKKRHQLEQV